jgi:hypothetical protein
MMPSGIQALTSFSLPKGAPNQKWMKTSPPLAKGTAPPETYTANGPVVRGLASNLASLTSVRMPLDLSHECQRREVIRLSLYLPKQSQFHNPSYYFFSFRQKDHRGTSTLGGERSIDIG